MLRITPQLLSLYFASYYFAAMGGALSMEMDMGQSVYESFGTHPILTHSALTAAVACYSYMNIFTTDLAYASAVRGGNDARYRPPDGSYRPHNYNSEELSGSGMGAPHRQCSVRRANLLYPYTYNRLQRRSTSAISDR